MRRICFRDTAGLRISIGESLSKHKLCWCSNYSPSVAINSVLCNEPCPGYPNGTPPNADASFEHVLTYGLDLCGNETSGLYSYVQIGQSSGSLSQATVSPTSSSTSSSDGDGTVASTASLRSVATVTVNYGTTVIITSFIPGDPTTTMSDSLLYSPTSNPGSISSVASSGESTGPIQSAISNSMSFWSSTGKVAGLFVAIGVIVAILGIVTIWMCRRRRRRQDEEKTEELGQSMGENASPNQGISRSASLLQLLGKRDRSYPEQTTGPVSGQNIEPVVRSPTELRLPVVDQRLDPQSMMIRFDENDSRTSFRDEEDYSRRVWRVTNASDSDSVRTNTTGR